MVLGSVQVGAGGSVVFPLVAVSELNTAATRQ